MGNTQASQVRSTNRHSTDGGRFKAPREHKRHGVVTVKIHTVSTRNTEDQINHVLTPKGALLYGSLFNAGVIVKALEGANYPLMMPAELMVPDSRAHKLLVTYCQGWQLIPFPEVFSRHSGTCVIVGDRNMPSIAYPIKVGDCFRLGSVGVVVSELKLEDQEEERLDARTLDFLKDEALAFDTSEDLAGLATDEMEDCKSSHGSVDSADDHTVPNYASGLTNGEKYICYMCYETHNTFEDPLIAPCECKGDTRFLHVQCLQKWYHSSAHGSRAQVIRTTGNGAPACKICGTAYKTNFRRPDGKKTSILEMENNGPYLSLVVVTHHDTNPGLFNTKFRLNFGRRANAPAHLSDEELNTIVIGRSSSCTMILDYRTVSTIHAKISYAGGAFVLTDNRSSNGTMVYLQNPFPLPYSAPIKVRMGRTTLTIQAKRSWTAALRAYVAPPRRTGSVSVAAGSGAVSVDMEESNSPSPYFLHALLTALPPLPSEKADRAEPGAEDFMNARSYTIRTLNDASAEVEYDHDLYNATMMGGRFERAAAPERAGAAGMGVGTRELNTITEGNGHLSLYEGSGRSHSPVHSLQQPSGRSAGYEEAHATAPEIVEVVGEKTFSYPNPMEDEYMSLAPIGGQTVHVDTPRRALYEEDEEGFAKERADEVYGQGMLTPPLQSVRSHKSIVILSHPDVMASSPSPCISMLSSPDVSGRISNRGDAEEVLLARPASTAFTGIGGSSKAHTFDADSGCAYADSSEGIASPK